MSDGGSKQAIREAALQRRDRIGSDAKAAFAERLARLGPELARGHGARVVSAFASIGAEVPTGPLLQALHDAGLAVALPVTGRRGTPLIFRQWTPETIMVSGRMNIPEPPSDAPVLQPDLLFVPLAAFDRRGHRIGYGAGFFDATLAALRKSAEIAAIGVAFSAQEELFIPAESHDEPLDMVVTEQDTIVFADEA